MPTNFDGTGRFRPDPSLTAPWEEQPKATQVRMVSYDDRFPKEDDAVSRIQERNKILRSELRTQMQQAWHRLDYKTADRIADLLGEPRPTDHEKAY